MIQFAIVDDDIKSIETIHRYIDLFYRTSDEEYHITKFQDGDSLLANYQSLFDIIFLDVEMKRSNGINVAKSIRETDNSTVIIFISRMAKYAVAGYSVNALDYVAKPVDYASFELKLRKALNHLKQHQTNKIQLNLDGKYLWLSTDDILYIEVFDHRLLYHTTKGDYSTGGVLSTVLAELKKYNFRQCNRYCIVNLKYVTKLQDNDITVGSKTLQVSKRRRREIVDALLLYFGGRI